MKLLLQTKTGVREDENNPKLLLGTRIKHNVLATVTLKNLQHQTMSSLLLRIIIVNFKGKEHNNFEQQIVFIAGGRMMKRVGSQYRINEEVATNFEEFSICKYLP